MKRSIVTALATVSLVAAAPATATPNLRDVDPPDVRVNLRPFGLRHLGDDCRVFSDFHVYSPGGKPFRQRVEAAGPYWVDRTGDAVAGLDRVNCDLISFRSRRLIGAAWRG